MDVSSAQKTVLQPSQSVPDGTPIVHGFDFNAGVDYEKLFDSYATTGFQATHLSMAIEEINKMLYERGAAVKLEEGLDPCFPYPAGRKRKALTLFLGYTSNLVSSGLRDIFRFLVQHDFVDCVVTSAGGVEEDLIKCLKPTYIGSFRMDGTMLREKGLNRAGNLLIPNENYCSFEEWLMPILDQCLREQQEHGALWTPSKLIDRLGWAIDDESSICYWAHRNQIPIFCPALTDGSLGDMLYFHAVANAPGIRLDIVEDVRHINTMAVKSFKTGVIILGGGFVKHHINNANLMRNGSDYTVYVNTGQEFDGSDSGAEPDEAVSWGKVKGTTKAVKVTADATLVFPIIAARCFAKRSASSVKSVDPPSLTKGSVALSSVDDLRVPVGHRQSTTITFTSDELEESTVQWQNGCAIPGAVGPLIDARVVYVDELTKRGAVVVKKMKRELHVALDNSGDEPSRLLLDGYDAGDAVYFAFANRADEVAILLERLGQLGTAADRAFTFSTAVGGEGGIPYVPNPCSVRYLLTHCLDIRRSPGRPVLRALAERCANAAERRRMLELCSAQGTDEFTRFVRTAGLSLIDLLLAFPSCRPSIECLMDLLPRLMPRAYSIANHKTGWKNRLRFVYSLLETSVGNGVQFARYGACSGWMRALRVGDIVRIALKEPSKFRLPPILRPELDITRCPLILIGPGTGIAPFISFLQKIRSALKKCEDAPLVKRYLFYGSSDLSEEFLFKDELKELHEAGVLTDLIVCESRPKEPSAGRQKYVYDALKARCYEMAEMLAGEKHDPPPLIFACGDVKKMSKDLWACLGNICEECLGLFRPEIVAFLQRLRTSERLIEDVWS